MLTDIFTSFSAVTLKRDKYFVSNAVISNNESIGKGIAILVLFFCVITEHWVPDEFHVNTALHLAAWRVFFLYSHQNWHLPFVCF